MIHNKACPDGSRRASACFPSFSPLTATWFGAPGLLGDSNLQGPLSDCPVHGCFHVGERQRYVLNLVLTVCALACQVTRQLLGETNAGKTIKKLTKHANPEIAAAAKRVVDTWMDAVKREQEQELTTGLPTPLRTT